MTTFDREREAASAASQSCVPFVQTHVGPIPCTQLGITLVHEHIFNRFPFYRRREMEEFTLTELQRIRERGVDTIIDLTPYTSLAQYGSILQRSPVRIVCCTGFYTSRYVPRALASLSFSALLERLERDITNGRNRTAVRAGILKIAAQGEELTPLESKFFEVVAAIQRRRHLPIATHSPKGAYSHVSALMRAGADPAGIFVSHMDRGLGTSSRVYRERVDEIERVLGLGVYVLFTEFGTGAGATKSASAAAKAVFELSSKGHNSKLLISSDSAVYWRRNQLRLRGYQWGGIPRTWEYVFNRVIPSLESAGLTSAEIKTMTKANPARLFSYFNLHTASAISD